MVVYVEQDLFEELWDVEDFCGGVRTVLVMLVWVIHGVDVLNMAGKDLYQSLVRIGRGLGLSLCGSCHFAGAGRVGGSC